MASDTILGETCILEAVTVIQRSFEYRNNCLGNDEQTGKGGGSENIRETRN